MSSKIEINTKDVDLLLEDLKSFQENGVKAPMERAAKKIVNKLKLNVVIGKDINGQFYPPVKKVTNEMEISRSGPYTDTRKRSDVTSSPTAMDVTGKSMESIKYEKKANGDIEIGFDSPRSELIFRGNAQASGNVKKPKRDPLGLTERFASDTEFEFLADEIEAALEKVLSGL